ncbi:MAG: adenosine deaminase [Deltaproteobacteria bacterium]|nr:MAG: adenosine deaminase [Deltaproteobacteria bacterium]
MENDERRQLLLGLPKVDLHRHLEGSLRLGTLLELGRRYNLDLPLDSEASLAPQVTFREGQPRTLDNFLAKFRADWYRSFADVERVAREAVEDAAAEGVVYLELRFSPEHLTRESRLQVLGVIQAVCEAGRLAGEDSGCQVNFLLTFARERLDAKSWPRIVEDGLRCHHLGVVGVDLAGDEFRHPNRLFGDFFARVRDTGVLHVTVHAGEGTDAGSVASAIEVLGAERIGHGLETVNDSRVIELVRRRRVALEMCPISNYQTGCVDDVSSHPLPRLDEQQLAVTINSDDPAMHGADLTDNYDLAVSRWGFDLERLLHLELAAARAAFVTEDERRQLLQRINAGYAACRGQGL